MWFSASGPPTSGLSSLAILPEDATQCDQSVCTSPDSTWKPAVDEPHMNPAGNDTVDGGGAGCAGPLDEELHATARAVRSSAAAGEPRQRSMRHRTIRPGRCRQLPLETRVSRMGLLDGKVA